MKTNFVPTELPKLRPSDRVDQRTRLLLSDLTSRPLPQGDNFDARLIIVAESLLAHDRFILPLWFGMNKQREIGVSEFREDWALSRKLDWFRRQAHDCCCTDAGVFFFQEKTLGKSDAAVLITCNTRGEVRAQEWAVTQGERGVVQRWSARKRALPFSYYEPYTELRPALREIISVEVVGGSFWERSTATK